MNQFATSGRVVLGFVQGRPGPPVASGDVALDVLVGVAEVGKVLGELEMLGRGSVGVEAPVPRTVAERDDRVQVEVAALVCVVGRHDGALVAIEVLGRVYV